MPRAKPAQPKKETGDVMESLIERTDPEADKKRTPADDDDDDEDAFERDPEDEDPDDDDDDSDDE